LEHGYENLQEEFNCFADSIHKVGMTINGWKTEFKESKETRNTLDIVEEFAWLGALLNAINISTEL